MIFAHEVILRHYSIRAFAPVTISAYVSQVIAAKVFQRPRLVEVGEVSIQHTYKYGEWDGEFKSCRELQ